MNSPNQISHTLPDAKKPGQEADEAASVSERPVGAIRHGVELLAVLSGLSVSELEQMEKKSIRKIDTRMLPTLIIVCKCVVNPC
jgi:hypothetical protein